MDSTELSSSSNSSQSSNSTSSETQIITDNSESQNISEELSSTPSNSATCKSGEVFTDLDYIIYKGSESETEDLIRTGGSDY